MSADHPPLIEVRDLTKNFTVKSKSFKKRPATVHAVDRVSFAIDEGETLGLVGESGCGKSTLGRAILRLIPATAGQVIYRGENIISYPEKRMWQARKKLQIIFQDPYNSLNPRMVVEDLVGAPLDVYKAASPKERRNKIISMLEDVGLGEQHLHRYPHEFSGGQQQRIGIARALILEPEFVVCDEPVSALDVSVRAQVLNLMQELQKKRGLTYLFISHDLSVVRRISNRVAVMYLGRIVEISDRCKLYDNPLHPYTQALISAIPIPDRKHVRIRKAAAGDIPNPFAPPPGCHFHTRCPYADEKCKQCAPELQEIDKNHWAACHLAGAFVKKP
jgi:oligopeptide/dipeptide ABC transporter ATP-binding protein